MCLVDMIIISIHEKCEINEIFSISLKFKYNINFYLEKLYLHILDLS